MILNWLQKSDNISKCVKFLLWYFPLLVLVFFIEKITFLLIFKIGIIETQLVTLFSAIGLFIILSYLIFSNKKSERQDDYFKKGYITSNASIAFSLSIVIFIFSLFSIYETHCSSTSIFLISIICLLVSRKIKNLKILLYYFSIAVLSNPFTEFHFIKNGFNISILLVSVISFATLIVLYNNRNNTSS